MGKNKAPVELTPEQKAEQFDELQAKAIALESENSELKKANAAASEEIESLEKTAAAHLKELNTLQGVVEDQTKVIEALEESKKAGVEVISIGKVPHNLVVPSFYYKGEKWDAKKVHEADKKTLEELAELQILVPAGKEDN
jgi:chromosome segregation ATPase